jgi:hypothetical protein
MVAVSRQPEFGSLHVVVNRYCMPGLNIHDKNKMLRSNQMEKETTLRAKVVTKTIEQSQPLSPFW